MTRRAFTLIELLVVVSIIALLIGLLLPALARTRQSAKLMLCMSNQRSTGTAIHAYSRDFDGEIPYGPPARPISVADFYVVDGMVTTQLSLLDQGKPVGAGLLLDYYLANEPEVLFCPDHDQPFDAERELSRIGKTQALCTYFYRHGSNTLSSASDPPSTWDDHIRLENLGRNRNGAPIRALLMDQNFLVDPPVPAFNVVVRTNHQRQRSNALNADGSVKTLDNSTDLYTANIGNSLHLGTEEILRVFEEADVPD
jgi:prepilin-type N-terminal cleavage/methylation domain-containing protein